MATTIPQDFTKKSYPSLHTGTFLAASRIAPFILGLFPSIGSVVDIGCGGAWLHVFSSLGCTVFGYDFGIGVPEVLMVDRSLYEDRDLSVRFKPCQRYDSRCL